MDFLVITISNLIWILYCLTEGVREGFFNHYRNTWRGTKSYNFKRMFFVQRLLVLLATGGIMLHTIGLIAIPFILGQLLMFHWLHKLSYNCTINKIGTSQEESNFEAVEKTKKPLILFGITLQVLVYLFFM